MNVGEVIYQMKEYAKENHIPIMTEEGLRFLLDYLKKNHVQHILEVGTAIGYSAICMCNLDPSITVVTIERDEERYLEAVKNVKKAGMEERIQLIYHDALDVHLEEKFDFIFIDAAKTQNMKFFQKFSLYLKDGGTILTDNMNFHGLVFQKEEEIESRNLRQLVRKVKDYKTFLTKQVDYQTKFYDIGDGLAVSVKL